MSLTLPALLALSLQCAPTIAPETMLSLVRVESGSDPLAIGVNGAPGGRVKAADRADAIAKASTLIRQGRSLDLGLAQINSRNLDWLGLSIEQAFEPCANLKAAERVLQEAWRRTSRAPSAPQTQLRRALSIYNTGSEHRGLANGYVRKVTAAAAQVVPALQAAVSSQAALPAARSPVQDRNAGAEPQAWDVFARAKSAPSFVFHPAPDAATGAAQ